VSLDVLLGPVSEQPPCGPNLEYDAEFQALDVAVRGKPEQVIGDKRIPAVPPVWQDVRESAQGLFARTKDLRVAIWWTRAAIAQFGVVGLRDGMALLHRLLESYWDAVHPQIDPADKDPGFRMNVLAGLVDPATTLREARHAAIADVPRKGRVTLLDVLLATGKLQPSSGESARTLAEVQGLLRDAASVPAALEAVGQAYALVIDLQKLLAEKVGSAGVPDFAPLRDLLAPAAELCRAVLEEAAGKSIEEVNMGQEAQGTEAVPAGASAVIRTREDAIRMLERVCEYVERSEPASPAPLLIRRAQRLMTKSFVEIIEDLTPDSLAVIKALGGIKD
jgi:type VI secretion system protein ImpA